MKRKTIVMMNCHDDDVFCFRKELIEALVDDGYTLVLSCPYGEKLEYFKKEHIILEDVKIDRRGTNPIKDIGLLISYIKLLKKYNPEAALAFTIKPNIYGSLAARFCRIKYINNITGLGSGFDQRGIVKSIILMMYKSALKKSSMVFFQNNENQRIAVGLGLVTGDYETIPGSGVNTERFSLQEYPDGGNGLAGPDVVFNYIGRVLKDKGVDNYIEAAKSIKRRYPNTEFNIIGFIEPTENHYENELQRLEEEGILVYRGQQNDIRPYIARSHATIHPSMYGEGMSNVLLESASSGRVLITTVNSGCRETVDAGKTGFVYDGSITGLIDSIEKFLAMDNTKRKEWGLNGREKVKKEFSRDYVIDAYRRQL